MNIKNFTRSLWPYLGIQRKKRLVALFALMCSGAIFEVISIGALLPFLTLLTKPSELLGQPVIKSILEAFRLEESELLLFFTIFFISMVLVSAFLRLHLVRLQARLAQDIGGDLSSEIYKKILNQPYEKHLRRNSSEIISVIFGKVDVLIASGVLSILTIMSSIFTLSVIIILLMLVSIEMTVVASIIFGFVYLTIVVNIRRRLKLNGQRISENSDRVIKVLQEGLGGIRDVILDRTQATYCDVFERADSQRRNSLAGNAVLGSVPRYFIEGFAVSLIATFSYFLALKAGGISAALPTLGVFVLAAQRLLPVMQQAYYGWSSFNGAHASISDVLSLLSESREDVNVKSSDPMHFERSICLSDVYFRYPGKASYALKSVNLEIKFGSCVGFLGCSGGGKSTLLDLIMGLLTPTHGTLEVDGMVVTRHNRQSWQSLIAHVPQSIFLADKPICENIAFGVAPGSIDIRRVRSAAERAQLAETIESLEYGYETFVGERGVRLSGGQRQRLGLARALYKQAKVLVLDEATSALDSQTEEDVMRAIQMLGDSVTTLIVAHRLTTLKNCDVVYEVVNQGLREANLCAHQVG